MAEENGKDARSIEWAKLEFEQLKHKNEVSLREQEIEEARRESQRAIWKSPLFLAVVAAFFGLLSNAFVAGINGESQRNLERLKITGAQELARHNAEADRILARHNAEADRILEALKTGDPDKAAENLKLLLETELISSNAKAISNYLKVRKPGEGASLPVPGGDSTGGAKIGSLEIGPTKPLDLVEIIDPEKAGNCQANDLGCALAVFHSISRGNPEFARERRNEIQERLLAASNQRCSDFKDTLSRDFHILIGSGRKNRNQSRPIDSAPGTRLSEDTGTEMLANLVVATIISGIDRQRADIYHQEISTQKSSTTVEYPLETAIRDAIKYHAMCSALSGLQFVYKTIETVP